MYFKTVTVKSLKVDEQLYCIYIVLFFCRAVLWVDVFLFSVKVLSKVLMSLFELKSITLHVDVY